jgi:hypothetical protein
MRPRLGYEAGNEYYRTCSVDDPQNHHLILVADVDVIDDHIRQSSHEDLARSFGRALATNVREVTWPFDSGAKVEADMIGMDLAAHTPKLLDGGEVRSENAIA